MPSLEASNRNLLKAKARWKRPRPWRSTRESGYIRSLVWQWHLSPHRCSARRLARELGVSHTWILKLVRRFRSNPARQERQERTFGPATLAQLRAEQQANEEKRRKGWYRPLTFYRGGVRSRHRLAPMYRDVERRIKKWMVEHGQ